MTEIQIKELVDEFKKFVAIVIINYEKGKKIEMVSELVDELWHTFILFTNDYRKFCDTTVGEYIHHDPNVNAEDRNGPSSSLIKREILNFFMRNMKSTLDLRRLYGSRKFPKKILHRKP